MEKQSPPYTWILQTPDKPGLVQVCLVVRDAGGGPAARRKVTGDVWMPAMPMPGYPLELKFEEAEEGRYFALVQYGHGGQWQIRAMFRDDQDQIFQQSFDFTILE
ncbi:MAG: FixH family protein [Desulfovibrio sp.]|nr:FixH family protein [Desulfovibrio sp.]